MVFKKIIIPFIFFTFVLTGCATYSIQSENLISQLKQNQKILFNGLFTRFSIFNSPSNHIDSIKCVDKKGNLVWLYPENNTTFIFVRKSTRKKRRADFNTIVLIKDTLYSRAVPFFGKVKKIPVSDIDKIAIRVERPKVKPISK